MILVNKIEPASAKVVCERPVHGLRFWLGGRRKMRNILKRVFLCLLCRIVLLAHLFDLHQPAAFALMRLHSRKPLETLWQYSHSILSGFRGTPSTRRFLAAFGDSGARLLRSGCSSSSSSSSSDSESGKSTTRPSAPVSIQTSETTARTRSSCVTVSPSVLQNSTSECG